MVISEYPETGRLNKYVNRSLRVSIPYCTFLSCYVLKDHAMPMSVTPSSHGIKLDFYVPKAYYNSKEDIMSEYSPVFIGDLVDLTEMLYKDSFRKVYEMVAAMGTSVVNAAYLEGCRVYFEFRFSETETEAVNRLIKYVASIEDEVRVEYMGERLLSDIMAEISRRIDIMVVEYTYRSKGKGVYEMRNVYMGRDPMLNYSDGGVGGSRYPSEFTANLMDRLAKDGIQLATYIEVGGNDSNTGIAILPAGMLKPFIIRAFDSKEAPGIALKKVYKFSVF